MRPDTSPSDTTTSTSGMRVAVLHVRNLLTHETRTSEPLSIHYPHSNDPSKQSLLQGIPIGRGACLLDPLVSVTHGTLECTPQHGVWVYVDHSEHGTTLVNQKQRVHRDAVVVRDGDVLAMGNTEITLTLQTQQRTLRDDASDNNQASVPAVTHSPSPPPPPPPPAPILSSQHARQMLPNIQTKASTRLQQQPPPEYINSPIPGSNWRKKRHSISHITRKPLAMIHGEPEVSALVSASQSFTRSKPLALVPSAPSTPPQKDASPAAAARHVNHHHHHRSLPPSAFPHSHVQFNEELETIPPSETILEEGKHVRETLSQSNQPLPTPPPLEYSSSPVTSAAGMAFLTRQQHSASSASPLDTGTHASKPSPPTTPAPTVPFVHTAYHYESPQAPTRSSHRPMDLRIQVAKRNAGLAAASRPFSAGTTTTPTAAAIPASTATTRPALLSRGITIPTTQHTSPPSSSSIAKRRLEFTPPASPVAHQDILRQNQSLLNILKTKYKEEQKLKREQEEWMRSQFPSSSLATPSVPSVSPIRHDKEAGLDDGNDEDLGLILPPKAPALLRTVSLGQTLPVAAHHHYHQPSPRLTQAVLASRARKGSYDGGKHRRHSHHHHHDRMLSLHGDESLFMSRVRSSSDSSSVASSVSTEPSNRRRAVHSLTFSPRASGELSEFLGYDDDDDDDGLLSFTSFYGDAGLDTTSSRTPAASSILQRSRLPSLDDDMAGVLNSPSHASSPASAFSRHSAFAFATESSPVKEPQSVPKPRARSAELRRAAAEKAPSRRTTHNARYGSPHA